MRIPPQVPFHTVTWDAKADWNVSYGNVELAVVAQDDRELMNFHFLTLPATDSNSTPLKISRSPVDTQWGLSKCLVHPTCIRR